MANKIIVDNGYVIATATTPFGTDTNADEIEQMLCHQPQAESGHAYMLKADTLEWELVELPEPEPVEDEATTEDYEAALAELGVK